jgi:hypothetical protein
MSQAACERWPKSEPSADPISEPAHGSAIKGKSSSIVKQATSIVDQRVAHSVNTHNILVLCCKLLLEARETSVFQPGFYCAAIGTLATGGQAGDMPNHRQAPFVELSQML